jgi:transcriptional regulator of arginine metabolism
MNKQFRHEQILKLVRESDVHTQEDLARNLRRLGIRTTQVTLSRDLKELNVAKTPAGYRRMGESTPAAEEVRDDNLRRAAGDFLRDVRQAQNLLVLKTTPGAAQPVGFALDAESWPEVVGTIAGDDTILVIAGSTRKAKAIHQRLIELIR